MGAFGRGENPLDPCEILGRLEHLGLLDRHGLHQPVSVELGEHGAHAVVAQPAGVVGGGHKAAAQRVHFGQGADLAGVAEVVGKAPAGKAGAGGRLHRDKPVARLAAQLLAHKGGYQTAQVGAAAGAADDDVGAHAVLVQRRLGLQADDRLVQQDLVEHAAQHIAVAWLGFGGLHRLGNGAAQAPARAGMLGKNPAAHLGVHGGGGGDRSAVGAHDLAAEGLLLVGDLDHVDLAVQAQVCAGHGQRGAPLPGSGFGGHALQALLLGIVCLRNGRIELVAAAGVVALKFVIDFGRGLQPLLQAVGPHQRGGAVHPVKAADFLGNREIRGGVVQLLPDQLVAEDRGELLGRHGLVRAGVEQGRRLVLHVGAHIVPGQRHFGFLQVHFVGNFLFGHGFLPFCSVPGTVKFAHRCRKTKNPAPSHWGRKRFLRYHPDRPGQPCGPASLFAYHDMRR